ncbi:precorrin-4 C(11)-methyltransferase [Vallitalea sp.]|jgi:precorrin-4/cobalt-precorrin-4 C11-methyltransferase|uniref:precorrin-4 C(11)-methyltransferase n=1 Tax=Vallitalea sp. TaxID=1882829 RepID=UPI0025D23A98|nr:precorrin-4 C(11)-methyltransferase [Vallitalea sp.]MCT4687766.1 precorrin-4 C(11)-methyltransferase [Vallitalea sp.]
MILFVGAGPGDVELITVKGMKALQEADCVIYAGSLVNPKLIDTYCKEDVIIYNSAKMDLDEVIKVMVEMEKNNKKVVRLHTGDPSIYGAIREQMDRLIEHKIEFDVIPGVSSFVAAASRLKEEFTLPNVSQTIIITRLPGRTGHGEGGQLEELAKHRASMAIFLSVQSISEVMKKLRKSYDAKTPVAVVYKATWDDEKIVRGTLEDIEKKVEEASITRFAQILIGDFMSDKYSLSKLYDKGFSHMYRTAVSSEER